MDGDEKGGDVVKEEGRNFSFPPPPSEAEVFTLLYLLPPPLPTRSEEKGGKNKPDQEI